MARDRLSIRRVSSRRELIQALGGVAAGSMLAGCGGGGGDGTESPTAPPDTEPPGDTATPGETSPDEGLDPVELVDQRATFFTGIMTNNPQEGQWNPFNPAGNLRPYYGHAKFAWFSPYSQEIILSLFEDIEKEGNRFSLHLRDHHTWSPSGDPVTAHDLRTKFKLGDFIVGSSLREGAIDAYEVVNDKQLDLVMKNPELRVPEFFGGMMGDWLDIKHSVFGEWVERLEDASSDSERDSIQEEVVNFRWKNEDAELSGQFEPPELLENAMVFETRTDTGKPLAGQREGFPNETLYSELELHVVPEGQTELQLVQQGKSIQTAFRGASEELARAEDNPDIITQTIPTFLAYVMIPNPTAPHMGDPAVRQAMAYAIDWDRARDVAMPDSLAVPVFNPGVSGVAGPGPLADPEFKGSYSISYSDYIPDIPLDSFRKYGRGPKTDKAAEIMREAGYQRNSDDMWEDSDGEVVGPGILTSSIADFFLNQTLEWATSLQNFGFDTEADVLAYDQFFNRLGAGDYDTTIVAWFGNPPFGFNQQSMTYMNSARRDTPPQGWVAEEPIIAEVPEFGDMNGDMIEVNVSEKLSKAQTTADQATYDKLISEIAWVSNEALPTIFAGEIMDTKVLNAGDWVWPESGDALFPIQWYTDVIDYGIPRPRQ